MYVLGELISMWMNGKSISSRAYLFQNLLAGLAAIALCVILAVMLSGILVLGICYSIYNALLAQGVSPLSASLTIGSCLVCAIALLALLAWKEWLTTRMLPRKIIVGTSVNSRVHHVMDAFMRGLMQKSDAEKRAD